MAVVESFVSAIGSFASIIGLSVQIYDRSSGRSEELQDQRLGLYVALTDVSKTWKTIHNRYHVLSPEVRKISSQLADGNGGLVDAKEIPDKRLVSMFRGAPHLMQNAKNFEQSMEVYFREPRRKIERDPSIIDAAIKEIRDGLGLKVSIAAESIHRAQISALEAHANVCGFFNQVGPIMRRASWSDQDRQTVLNEFLNFPDDFDSVILDCDVVLLNVIELFEYISADLLGD
ncbi:hypothetical protein [Rhodovulum kholense]|uniref:Uncharacterized protein n=1 Tax=Rhodovulum kholense TaxID=453584 RepID=A0A8E2VGR8_9RHOB|nr:hypothetical protein [Rhodovulum kholense]PTW43917.1 hypothetical protein C8N38_12057 [Rhodovulum kholense]